MNKKNLETALTKLLQTFFTKKFDRDFSDLYVKLDEYDEEMDDIDDDGNWVSGESYYFTVYSNHFDGIPKHTLHDLARNLIGNLIGSQNWISIDFAPLPL